MQLQPGQVLPELACRTVDGGELTLPGDGAGRWAVLLFYRGHW